MTDQQTLDELAQALAGTGVDVRRDFSLAPMTTYGVGGRASVAVVITDIDSCADIAGVLARCDDVPVAVVGRGSNTLVADDGFHGVALIISAAPRTTELSLTDGAVVAPASMTMPVLARRSVGLSRGGLEWCVGIPGSVGGAVRMNAGGHGAEMVDSLVSARVLSLRTAQVCDVKTEDLGLHFRGSALSAHHLVVSACMSTSSIEISEGEKLIDEIVKWRRDHQPGGRNAGSVFVNPAPGDGSAGALIDSLGLRGYTVGGASVSSKHANFIQADQNATASDVVTVMSHVQSEVERASGIRLRSEVCLLGFSDEVSIRFADPIHSHPDRIDARQKVCALLGEDR